jgi:glycosyltransferase involved in cell wall biosynthesis
VNLLIVNHHAGSRIHGMVYRHYYFAREWVRMGHSVTIVAASFSHVRSRSPEVRRAVTEEEIDGIRYVWLKTPRYKGSSVRRMLNMMAFVSQLTMNGPRLVKRHKPDVIVSSSTYHLDIFTAWWLARKCGARLVFEVRDMWPLTPITLGDMSPRNPVIMAVQAAEDFGYRRAQSVVSALPFASEYMQSRGMSPDKFCYVPNGIDPMEFEKDCDELPALHEDTFKKVRDEARFIVGFTGAHGLAHDLDTVLDAAEKLRNEPILFALVGGGSQKKRLQEAAERRQLSNVVFLPHVPKTSVPSLLNGMDVLYIGLKQQPMFKFGVSPHKLLDYMMAAKPVIHAIDTPGNMVSEARCGVSILPGSSDQLCEAIRSLARLSHEELVEMGERGRAYVIANHDYRVLAERFLTCLDRTSGSQE